MSAVTPDVVFKSKPAKKRRKSMATIRKLRNALARKKLEEMHEDEILQEQIYDVFADAEDSS